MRGNQKIEILEPDADLLDHVMTNGVVSYDQGKWDALLKLAKRVPKNCYRFYRLTITSTFYSLNFGNASYPLDSPAPPPQCIICKNIFKNKTPLFALYLAQNSLIF